MRADKTFLINFTNGGFNQYHNDILKRVVDDYLESHPDLLLDKIISDSDLTKVILEVLANDLTNVINPNGLYHIVESIYDFWRDYKRYLFSDLSVSYVINETNFHDIFNNFNRMVLDMYRRVCLNLGVKFNIMRELPAGGNAFILLNRTNHYVYNELKDIPVLHSIVFRPPFVVNSKSNKRKGIFPIIDTNPVEGLDKEGFYCYPILVGKKRVFVYFKDRYMSLALALSNLFEHDDEYKNNKPDIVILFGSNTKEGIYYDSLNDVHVASLIERDEIDYFGYMKKIILTAYNIEMISVGGLPIHGACVSLTLKDHRQKNIILIGDSGAGKSETLEALRQVASDYVVDMTTIFDDMGTLLIEDNVMKAYGTEIGAFVRTDDLENGYTYKVFDRAIFMNPSLSNARIVLPISSYDDITTGINIDYILYANNYEESANKIRLFDNVASALEVFKKGARVAKGTTGETGLVTTFFANPFGPVQLEEETNVLLDKYFNYFFDNNIKVGEIYTGLALENGAENPIYAATELLKKLKED